MKLSKISQIQNFNDFKQAFKKRSFAEISTEISKKVTSILENVKSQGDDAVYQYTKQLDNFPLTNNNYKFTESEIKSAYKNLPENLISALKTAHKRITSYHEKQLPQNYSYLDSENNLLGWKWYPLESVGLYIPGGLATYPSSVLMTATIAKIAGVPKTIVCTPTPNDTYNPALLVACDLCGITDIYRVGGAQAIAAMAYGTNNIPQICKIFGPGNAYVTEAKKQLFGQSGIDMIAGPSEILILADNKTNPKWIAADLLSQAEHDKMAQSVLICDDINYAKQVENELHNLLDTSPRQDIATASYRDYGHIFVVEKLKELGSIIANDIAPEHIEILTENPEEYLDLISNAGAIFLGRYTPEAIGDYLAGPSHVLPTSGAAKFSSGLGVFDFMRRSSIIKCTPLASKTIFKDAALIADSESLAAHKLSLELRNEE